MPITIQYVPFTIICPWPSSGVDDDPFSQQVIEGAETFDGLEGRLMKANELSGEPP
ncbi:MAG: hypothetical protein GY937_21595 [bacterium]|nr:hypothetical protein [bacterium]